jgi:hypothetical protein
MTASVFLAERRHSSAAHAAFDELDSRLVDVFVDIHNWRGWKYIANRLTPRPQGLSLSMEIMRAIAWYQANRTEARLSLTPFPPAGETELTHALLDAADPAPSVDGHLLGPADRHLSPALFAVAALRDRIARIEGAFGLLGAEYLFEQITMLVVQTALPLSEERDIRHDGLRLALKRAAENTGRLAHVKHLILDMATRYPDSSEAMLRGFECFRVVYPMAVWDEAYGRVIRSNG